MNKKSKTASEKLQDELEPIKDFLEEDEKERRTNPLDSFSEDLRNSIKKSRRQTEDRKSNK